MKTPLPSLFFHPAAPPRRPRRRAFSLVEVTLALGIVTFGLVGVVGVLPTALASGRQSFDQNRAAAIADTLFTSFRSQPFNKVCYVDAQFGPDGLTPSGAGPTPIDFDLVANGGGGNAAFDVTFYAKILGVATDTGDAADAFGAQRRLSFSARPPAGGADYQIALNFYDTVAQTTQNGAVVPAIPASNQPEGMVMDRAGLPR